jgi:hypothetical protein
MVSGLTRRPTVLRTIQTRTSVAMADQAQTARTPMVWVMA